MGKTSRSFFISLLSSLVFTTFLSSLPSFAQNDRVTVSGRGTLTGSVTDSQGRMLQGAQVKVDPGDVTTVSDPQGLFVLSALTAGEYSVTITYAGFEAFTQKVTVAAGQPVRVDTALKVGSNNQQVNVYAGRQGGEVEAINRTFTADNIINVLPADVITSLPNANVPDAIGRLPGVTLERDEGEGKYVQIAEPSRG